VIDIVVIEPYSAQEAIDALKPALPCSAGQACISVVSVQEIPLNSPALATLFRQATYHITLSGIPEIEVERQVADFLRQDEVPVEFRRKRFDLRPLVSSLRVGGTPAHARGVTPMCAGETLETEQIRSTTCLLEANLVRDSKGRIGRPDVLLQALGLNEHARRIHRQEMVFDETK
jgi:hypothetical protein